MHELLVSFSNHEWNTVEAYRIMEVLVAAAEGQQDKVECLLSEGADINEKDGEGWTPLHHSSSQGHLGIVKCLVKQGADVNKADNIGWTSLHRASWNRHLDVVACLVKYGSDLNKPNHMGQTALHVVSGGGCTDEVEYLANQGAELNVEDENGWTPLHHAASEGHQNVVRYLLDRKAEVNTRRDRRKTALHLAACGGHLEVVQDLVSQGAEVSVKDSYGCTALHHATFEGHFHVVRYLVDQGADVAVGDNIGWTPLHHAAWKIRPELVNYFLNPRTEDKDEDKTPPNLVSQNASRMCNYKDRYGRTPLHLATQKGCCAIIETLVRHGADVNIQSYNGRTCLHLAIEYYRDPARQVEQTQALRKVTTSLPPKEALIRFFVENGAKLNLKDAEGHTPLSLVKDDRIMQLILSCQPKDGSSAEPANGKAAEE